MSDKLEVIIIAKDQASGVFNKLTKTVGTLGSIAGTAVLGGVAALGAGLVTAGVSGLSFNNSMEIVEAQLNAFTKDGAKTAEILDMIRERAAKTPFAFEEMAKATSSLMSSAKASGQSLESLVEQAEILAASNPAQGLEGAAFALKEAVSGDFTSIIERFNLPRQFINQLKEEGVPNLEIVQRAMQELGLDTSLVANLAETASGRWSTFLDTLQGLAAQITQPIFDAFSDGLGTVNQLLVENEPVLKAFAEQLAVGLQQAISWVITSGIPAMNNAFISISTVLDFLKPYWADLIAIFNQFLTELLPLLQQAWLELQAVWADSIQPALAELGVSLQELFEALGINTEQTDFWQIALGTLKIGLGVVTTTIRGLTPLIRALGEVIQFGTNNVRLFVDMLRGMKNSADALMGVLRSIRDRIRDVINAASNMPDWLIPGSPTPFEMGIRGIADAVNSLPQMQLPGMGVGALTPAAVGGSVSGVAPVVVQVQYSPVLSMADEIELEKVLTSVVNKINRKGA